MRSTICAIIPSLLGDWILISTEVTDKSGRICFNLSEPNVMGYGIYPVRMVVRGDHTMLHLYLAVVPPQTEAVVYVQNISAWGKGIKARGVLLRHPAGRRHRGVP